MTLWNRQQRSSRWLLIGAAGVLVLVMALNYYFDQRASLIEQRDANVQALNDGTSLLQRQAQLRQLTAKMQKSVASDATAAEGQLLHLVQNWEQRSQVSGVSFQRVGTSPQHGFVLLTFEVSATGDMPSVAGFLYQVETASIPLRIENLQMHCKNGSESQVEIQLEFSTLYRGIVGQFTQPVTAGAVESPGGPA